MPKATQLCSGLFFDSITICRAVTNNPRNKGIKEIKMVIETATAAAESAFAGDTASNKEANKAATKTEMLRRVSAQMC